MHVSVRGHLMAGVAVLCAGAVVLAPIAPPPDIAVPMNGLANTAPAGGRAPLADQPERQAVPPVLIGDAVVLAIGNLMQNAPLVARAALDKALAGDVPGALETLAGPVLAAAVGVTQSVVVSIEALGAVVRNLIENAPIILAAALKLAQAGDFVAALEAITGPLLAVAIGIAQVVLPSSVMMTGNAVGAAATNLAQNGPLILRAALGELLAGDPEAAMRTFSQPALTTVAGVAQVALPPEVFTFLGATGVAITNLAESAPLIVRAAMDQVLAGDFVGALRTVVEPVLAAVVGVVQAVAPPPKLEVKDLTINAPVGAPPSLKPQEPVRDPERTLPNDPNSGGGTPPPASSGGAEPGGEKSSSAGSGGTGPTSTVDPKPGTQDGDGNGNGEPGRVPDDDLTDTSGDEPGGTTIDDDVSQDDAEQNEDADDGGAGDADADKKASESESQDNSTPTE